MKLRNGKIINIPNGSKICNHEHCILWMKTEKCCCYCADKRPEAEFYYAYNQSYLMNATKVDRSYYYCASCKGCSVMPKLSVEAEAMPVNKNDQLIIEAHAKINALQKLISDAKTLINDLQRERMNGMK